MYFIPFEREEESALGAEHWIWMQRVLGYGSRRLQDILNIFGDAEEFYRMRDSERIKSVALSARVTENIHNILLTDAEKTLALCRKENIEVISFANGKYPPQLKILENPPAVLYSVGVLTGGSGDGNVTVVGTRRSSEYGRKAAFSLSYRLAKAGCVIVSGTAGGIDTAAHLGTLAANGRCIAVLPYGHRKARDDNSRELSRKILEAGGCLLSELPPDASFPRNVFVLRNRLLAALSAATAVVEAPEKSGSLITANAAAQYGKYVFVVTGRPDDPRFAGSYALIRDGASPVFDARDILSVLPGTFAPDVEKAFAGGQNIGALYRKAYKNSAETQSVDNVPGKLEKPSAARTHTQHSAEKPDKSDNKTPPAKKRKVLPDGLTENAVTVYGFFSPDGEYLDTLVEKTGLSVGKVLSALTELEIYGLAACGAGGKYELSRSGTA